MYICNIKMNWAEVAQSTKPIESKPIISKIVEDVNQSKQPKTPEVPEYHYPNRFELVQEQFSLEIQDTFQSILEEVQNGPYGYVFSEDRSMRGLDFIHMVHKHLDYGYYKIHGFENNERINGEDNSSEEEQYWVEKRNKFAYV